MESSPEIVRVVGRWLTAVRAGDTEAMLARMSEQPGVLVVGSDDAESWHGEHRAVWEAQSVQLHLSAGFPNEQVFGRELTELEQLEDRVRTERPDLTGSLGADGTVTIVFTDIVDSTVLTTRLGDHAGSTSSAGTAR